MKLNPEDIIYGEFASGGAMGDCGSVRIYSLNNGELIYNYANVYSEDKNEQENYAKFSKLLFDAAQNKILDRTYGGFGNEAFRKKGLIFERDDDNCAFIYHDGKNQYSLKASVLGVYECVARVFAKRKITKKIIKEWENSKNLSRLSDEEQFFLKNYIDYSKTDRVKITLTDYFDAIDYLQYINLLDSHFASSTQLSNGKNAISKYRLKYVLEKLGKNKTEEIFVEFKIKNSKVGDLFKLFDSLLGESLSEKFSKFEVIKTDCSNLDETSDDFKALFNYPVVVDFSISAHEKIVASILEASPSELCARESIGYYFASCHYCLDKISLAKILPAAFCVLKNMPTNDFNYTNIDITYYAAHWLVDRAWRAISVGGDEYDERFGNLVYKFSWFKIDGLWPIKNYGKFIFVRDLHGSENEAGEYIFDLALHSVLAVDNLNELNPELYNFLKIKDYSMNRDVRRKIFLLSLETLSDEEIFEKLKTYFKDNHSFEFHDNLTNLAQYFLKTKNRANFIIRESLNKNGIFSERNFFEKLWTATLSTTQYAGIGSFLIKTVVENFEKFEKKSDIKNLYFAACAGVDEEDEIKPLEEFKKKLLALKNAKSEKEIFEAAFKNAKKHIAETAFQRKELRENFLML